MDTVIKLRDEVWTADRHLLGVACALHYRPTEKVDLGARLYPVYLEIKNYELGEDFFVPLVSVVGRDPEGDHLLLDVTMKQVMNNTWGRMPDFIAKLESRVEALSADTNEALE